jgi:hypothetical protein
MKSCIHILAFSIVLLLSSSIFAQTTVMIGPRVTGNLNIYNEKGITGTWNGIGVGIGPTVDVTFGRIIGMMVNLTVFDMRNFSNSQTNNNVTTERSFSLSYLTIDPMFKTQFSGFYMVAGPSLGIKLNSSGEATQITTGQAPVVQAVNLDTKAVRFDIAVGTGYTFKLAPDMGLATDFMAHIPLSDTYNFPGISNSIFTLKLGVALKFGL